MEKEFLQIIKSNQGIIHKVTNIYCNNAEDKKDLFQEILSQLWKSFPKFKGDSKVSTWMYRIALNTSITSLRKTKRRKERFDSEHTEIEFGIEDNTVIQREEKLLYKAINQLTDVEKSIVMLYLEDYSFEEIAEMIDISQNYVRVKMTRIKAKLKKIMTNVY